MGGFLHRDSRLMREFTRAFSIDVLLLLLRLLLCDRTYEDRHKLHNVETVTTIFAPAADFRLLEIPRISTQP